MHLNPAIAAQLEALNNPSLPGIDLSLERVWKLLAALGNPHEKLPPVIHIAGTNGKGSTLAFLRAIYEAQGYRVHAYTSPHLVRFNERIVIAGAEVSDDYLQQLLARVAAAARDIPVTFFEATTAAAFLAFAEHSADLVLLETGMGGRLDATNVVAKPIATIITPIDYDHMEFLGDTLAAIAEEKAGIMKRDVPCFVAEQKPEAREVLKRAARKAGARLHLHGRDWSADVKANSLEVLSADARWEMPFPALQGVHQYHNAALASVVAMGLEALPVTLENVVKGILQARWPARLQRLSQGPIVQAWAGRGHVYLDGGHNPHAAMVLRAWAISHPQPLTLIVGMMQRKDALGYLKPLAEVIPQLCAVSITGHDAYDPFLLAQRAREAGFKEAFACEWGEFPARLSQLPSGDLLIAGSLFLAGEVLKNHS
jgi:dihydrofolate synthase/folylpolyglutamate synthase